MSTPTTVAPADQIDATSVEQLFRVALKIAHCDERMQKEVKAGGIKAATYPVRGLEGVCAAIGLALEPTDYLVSTYRNLGDAIAKGMPLGAAIAEISGRETGVAKGKGGAMHLADVAVGLMTTTGIVGAGLPIANGLALASQMSSDGRVTVVTFGDGATSIGAFHEALNLAALWKLPIVFVCQNNGWAEHTPVDEYMAQTDIIAKARSYGIDAERVDGFDAVATLETLGRAVSAARIGAGPRFVEAMTYRLAGHTSTTDFSYMDKDVLARHRADDAVVRLRARLAETAFDADAAEADVLAEIDAAFAFAASSPYPDQREAHTDAYALATSAPEARR
ncbi:thiamine pyrophosphate-dependent dehydrogenase E1 component subunit alpha [Microbacterium sp. zg.B48]|uniref:thiamine pyrophosphate-dependent dehydrogenase E1 component subunit alpha n=1 Tax=Microbacterium sp. zg.B48 TaxID=2969408 RepID=UPI00214D0BD2|nr:thiamine pyrophosphate-dependent dehydrogenase E1 component subunit alpha [Microbacterium sp. zg.B48]MCR2764337.1 thiamine pyrophosphate-dependent dehydrogenase E1 component subunit alpha [Microbacterium sp. zg.B48]